LALEKRRFEESMLLLPYGDSTAIYFYYDNTHHLFVMYLIIRCPSCSTFSYVDRFQKWKLCPQCGHAHEVARDPVYLDVEDFHEAEHIVRQMEKHLHTNKKKDFTPEETAELRHHYTEALRKRGRGYPVQ
jgi:acetyl-CoA carboxylase beta subunit